MKSCARVRVRGAWIATVALLTARVVGAALITISSPESWSGGVIHGVTPTGAGISGNPYVYAIPDGIQITSTGILQFDPNQGDAQGTTIAPYVTLSFSSGTAGLQIDDGGWIDTNIGARGNPRALIINLGTHSITGSGSVSNSNVGRQDGSMTVTIQGSNGASVIMDTLDNHVYDPNNTPNHVVVTVGGAVQIRSIDASDYSAGGDYSGNVTVRGGTLAITNGIKAYSSRTATAQANGNVTLEALGSPLFDPDNTGGNAMSNTITLGGAIDVEGSTQNQGGGNITIRGVVVTLNPTFTVDQEADSTLSIFAGTEPPFTGLHFFDNSTDPTNYTATYNVKYTTGAKRRSTETFDSAASAAANGWTASGNTNNGNSFGFTNSANVTGNAGEAGGVFARSGALCYYADTDIGDSFTRQDTFAMSGSMRLSNQDFDGAAFVGFFNRYDLTPPTSFIGMFISEPSGPAGDPFRVSARIQNAAGSPAEGASALVPVTQSTTVTFSLTWTGQPDGSGTLIGTINGTSVTASQASAVGEFNAFGIGAGFTGVNTNWTTGNCYFDSFAYGPPAGPVGTVIIIQ